MLETKKNTPSVDLSLPVHLPKKKKELSSANTGMPFMITSAHQYQIHSSLEKTKESLHQKNDEEVGKGISLSEPLRKRKEI